MTNFNLVKDMAFKLLGNYNLANITIFYHICEICVLFKDFDTALDIW